MTDFIKKCFSCDIRGALVTFVCFTILGSTTAATSSVHSSGGDTAMAQSGTPQMNVTGTTTAEINNQSSIPWVGSHFGYGNFAIKTNILDKFKEWLKLACSSSEALSCQLTSVKLSMNEQGDLNANVMVQFAEPNRVMELNKKLGNQSVDLKAMASVEGMHNYFMEGCGPGLFECAEGACIDKALTCNKVSDCAESDWDERVCGEKYNCSSMYEFQCYDGNCIPLAGQCDGKQDCFPSNEDESSCPGFTAYTPVPTVMATTVIEEDTTETYMWDPSSSAGSSLDSKQGSSEDVQDFEVTSDESPETTEDENFATTSSSIQSSSNDNSKYVTLAISLPTIAVVLFLFFSIILCVYVTRRERKILDLHVKNVKDRRKASRMRRRNEKKAREEEEERKKIIDTDAIELQEPPQSSGTEQAEKEQREVIIDMKLQEDAHL